MYLTRVCAASPVVLRRCRAGEHGVVISRYDRIGGYDWIAIPLIPYLYAVENPEDVPLYADNKLVAFLRDQYRRSHLEEIAPDGPSGETPKGDWVQLVGSSYDRTSYGFQIETSAAQDDAFIAWFNSRPNRGVLQSRLPQLRRFCSRRRELLLSESRVAWIHYRPGGHHAETCRKISGQIQSSPSGRRIDAHCLSAGSRNHEAQQAGSRRAGIGLSGEEIHVASR